MNRIEKLISEYGSLNFHFREDMPEGLDGLISQNNVYVNSKLPFDKLYATLAEEIGHYETSCSDIIDLGNIQKRKEEMRGRTWSYRKLLPHDELGKFINENEIIYNYDLAEEFGVPGDVVDEAINMYRSKGFL